MTDRAWQSACVSACLAAARHNSDLLVAATPGAGKTTFALSLAAAMASAGMIDHVVPVAHTRLIQRQWREAALARRLGATFTTSYPQVARRPDMHAAALRGRRPLVIMDECHHAADRRTWGKGLRQAFGGADIFRLLLSGTPFREDAGHIPFVTYGADGVCVPDFSYGYDAAIRDGVCRPVTFEPVNMLVRFKDRPTPEVAADMLRRSLDPRAGMVEAMVRAADAELSAKRALPGCGDAGALLVALDQEHAYYCAEVIHAVTGEASAVVVSDSATAERDLVAFRKGTERWLVAVKMVSEGVDVPRLMVGAYLTNTVTTLFFRQFVGRFVRTRAGAELAPAAVFIPRDFRLLKEAAEIGAEVRKGAFDGTDAAPALRRAAEIGHTGITAPRVDRGKHAFSERYRPSAWA